MYKLKKFQFLLNQFNNWMQNILIRYTIQHTMQSFIKIIFITFMFPVKSQQTFFTKTIFINTSVKTNVVTEISLKYILFSVSYLLYQRQVYLVYFLIYTNYKYRLITYIRKIKQSKLKFINKKIIFRYLYDNHKY